MTINLAAIEKRLNAITKWPWSIAYGGISESDEGFGIDSEIEPGIVAECWPPAADAERKKRCYADAHFIAHAPSDIAALVAEVRRLEAENSNLRAVLSECSATAYEPCDPVTHHIVGSINGVKFEQYATKEDESKVIDWRLRRDAALTPTTSE